MSYWKILSRLIEAPDDENKDDKPPVGANPFDPKPLNKISKQHKPHGSLNIKATKNQADRPPEDKEEKSKKFSPPPSKKQSAWAQTQDFLNKNSGGSSKNQGPLTPDAGSTAIPKFPGSFIGQEWTTQGVRGTRGTQFVKTPDNRTEYGKLYGYSDPMGMSSKAKQAFTKQQLSGNASNKENPYVARSSTMKLNPKSLFWNGEKWVSAEEFKTTHAPKTGKQSQVQKPQSQAQRTTKKPLEKDGYRVVELPNGLTGVVHKDTNVRGMWKSNGVPVSGDLTSASNKEELDKISSLVKDFASNLGENMNNDKDMDIAFKELIGDIRKNKPDLYKKIVGPTADPYMSRDFMRQVKQRALDMKKGVREAFINQMQEVDLQKTNIKKFPHASKPVNSEGHDESEDIEDLDTADDVIDSIELALKSLRHLVGDVKDHEEEESEDDEDDLEESSLKEKYSSSWEWQKDNPSVTPQIAQKILKNHDLEWNDFINDNPQQKMKVDTEVLLSWMGY